jgi:hypothetical protein
MSPSSARTTSLAGLGPVVDAKHECSGHRMRNWVHCSATTREDGQPLSEPTAVGRHAGRSSQLTFCNSRRHQNALPKKLLEREITMQFGLALKAVGPSVGLLSRSHQSCQPRDANPNALRRSLRRPTQKTSCALWWRCAGSHIFFVILCLSGERGGGAIWRKNYASLRRTEICQAL